MSVRANWFTADQAETAVELRPPMAPAEERIEDIGVPFDLRDPHSLLAALSTLIEQEAALWNHGVSCPIKDRTDTSCSACPIAHHMEQGHRLQPLCSIGREQERICTTRAAVTLEQHGG
jgi:hypothetical protein